MNDQEIIQIIRNKYDLTKDEDVLILFHSLQNEEITFSTDVGRRFDDYIYEKATEIKKKKQEAHIQATETVKKVKVKKKSKKVIILTKKQIFIKKLLLICLCTCATICFFDFGIYYYRAMKIEQENQRLIALKENEEINAMYNDDSETTVIGNETKYFKVLDQYKSLYHQNKNLIGWLKIADTIIDYPVMQTKDNEFYLTHNIKLDEDKNGTLFLDASCDVKTPSTNFIVYGHNMRSGKMFGALEKYSNESYFESHKLIEFDTIYETATYEVAFVFRSRIYNEEDVVFKYYQFIDAQTKEEFDSYMSEMKNLSLYDTDIVPTFGDQLLTLSTCDYEEEDGRFVVVARRIQ